MTDLMIVIETYIIDHMNKVNVKKKPLFLERIYKPLHVAMSVSIKITLSIEQPVFVKFEFLESV